jgi:NTP pyrophosphatase (non-canonical NTP hydrolase)
LEVGFAHACGVPILTLHLPHDHAVAEMVTVVASAEQAVEQLHQSPTRAPVGVRAFQNYYRRAAVRRGYNDKDAKTCLLLMVEEVGELAREIRKMSRITRHSTRRETTDVRELADVFLYVVHMANLLNVDLASLVGSKELVNHSRFLARK